MGGRIGLNFEIDVQSPSMRRSECVNKNIRRIVVTRSQVDKIYLSVHNVIAC